MNYTKPPCLNQDLQDGRIYSMLKTPMLNILSFSHPSHPSHSLNSQVLNFSLI